MSVRSAAGQQFAVTIPVVIIGAGAAGMIAALTARTAGSDALVLERDAMPRGNTSLSAGMIPAAGTRIQRAAGVADRPDLLVADILAKARNRTDRDIAEAVARASGPTIDWLVDEVGIELTLVTDFLYPGTSRLRMHAPPRRTGADLLAALGAATADRDIDVMTNAHITTLFADADGHVRGLCVERPDGGAETIGCKSLILACNGYGGNPSMVREHMPSMASALYFGHPGNTGDAVLWGRALGAATRHMSSFQGHGSVAHPHGILITWAIMMNGGIQVNNTGLRFSNEHDGYSEQAVRVLRQADHIAWNVYDERRHNMALDIEDYRQAQQAGAIRRADTIAGLGESFDLPSKDLTRTVAEVADMAAGARKCAFGRDFTTQPALRPPYYGVRVTGALFHTQGGLAIDTNARVRREDGSPLPNLLAAGGAACGISGPADWGYLSGNGLLTATTLGRIAGQTAARMVGARKDGHP